MIEKGAVLLARFLRAYEIADVSNCVWNRVCQRMFSLSSQRPGLSRSGDTGATQRHAGCMQLRLPRLMRTSSRFHFFTFSEDPQFSQVGDPRHRLGHSTTQFKHAPSALTVAAASESKAFMMKVQFRVDCEFLEQTVPSSRTCARTLQALPIPVRPRGFGGTARRC